MTQRQYRIGLVINPWAGLGGSVALKGSDGAATVAEALALGAKPQAGKRVAEALSLLTDYAAQLHFVTAAGSMGAQVCDQLGFHHTSVYTPSDLSNDPMTTAADTQAAVTAICDQGVDLLLFAGGDGTARDVCSVYPAEQPVLGIPAGVKIHSGVYAISPKAAGRVVELLVTGQLASLLTADVMDIDEAAFRQGTVRAKRYGEMRVPAELRYVQAVKMGGREADELVLADIAADIIERMDERMEERMDERMDDSSGADAEPLWIMGSGSTVAAIMEELHLPNTLLGVDVVQAGRVIAADVTATELAELAGQHQNVNLVVTLIGGQGHIFGRGNQQLSPQVIRQVTKDRLYVVATKQKLRELAGRPLLVDTGDAKLDDELAGFIRVITGYHDEVMLTIAAVN